MHLNGCDNTPPPDLISTVHMYINQIMWSCVNTLPRNLTAQRTACAEGTLDISHEDSCLEVDTMGAQGNNTSNSKSAHSQSPKILDGSRNKTQQTRFTEHLQKLRNSA